MVRTRENESIYKPYTSKGHIGERPESAVCCDYRMVVKEVRRESRKWKEIIKIDTLKA